VKIMAQKKFDAPTSSTLEAARQPSFI